MKISYNWLRQYIDTTLSPEEISKILVSIGLEVEGIEKWESVKGGLEGFVVAEVKECAKHPNADKLSCTKVDAGTGELLSVVCGAPNVATGQKVILATIGTKIYNGDESFEIKKSKIRGEESCGMLCAEDELGLGNSHDGIIVLDAATKIGTPAKEYFKVESDWVFEIGITPNRIDSASHYGVARDLSAYLKQQGQVTLNKPSVDVFKTDNTNLSIPVTIENTEACKRYCGVTIQGVTIAESPEWLQNRLKAIGLRPINNIVDITNYVLHETGQPLHAFDAAYIKGKKVVVRTCNNDSSFVTLDNTERKLAETDLMICNESEPMCMAGIFGGLHSGVSEKTKDIFLESAYFNPVWVRKTARRHGLSTDSSFRFERGADPNNTLYTLKRCALLIKEIAGGSISSNVVDVYPNPVPDFKVHVTFSGIANLIGKEIPKETIKNILTALEIKIDSESNEGMSLSVPPYRVDVQQQADIVEEILRIYGYNNIEIGEKVNSSLSNSQKPDPHTIQNLVSDYLSSNGFNEMMSNSLTKSGYYEGIESCKNRIPYIVNPLSSDLNCMRQSLIFGGLEAIIRNINFRNTDLKLYEFGNCYFFDKNDQASDKHSQYSENNCLFIALTGMAQGKNHISGGVQSSFYYLKAYVNNILTKVGINTASVKIEPLQHEVLSEGLAYKIGNKTLVQFGMVRKKHLKEFDIKQEVYVAEFDWSAILVTIKNHKVSVSELPKFPEVYRDLSMILDDKLSYAELLKVAEKVDRKLLRKIDLFDVYKGKGIEEGKKSYALSFTLLDDNQTLTDNQIDTFMNKLIRSFEKELGAQVRM